MIYCQCGSLIRQTFHFRGLLPVFHSKIHKYKCELKPPNKIRRYSAGVESVWLKFHDIEAKYWNIKWLCTLAKRLRDPVTNKSMHSFILYLKWTDTIYSSNYISHNNNIIRIYDNKQRRGRTFFNQTSRNSIIQQSGWLRLSSSSIWTTKTLSPLEEYEFWIL